MVVAIRKIAQVNEHEQQAFLPVAHIILGRHVVYLLYLFKQVMFPINYRQENIRF